MQKITVSLTGENLFQLLSKKKKIIERSFLFMISWIVLGKKKPPKYKLGGFLEFSKVII